MRASYKKSVQFLLLGLRIFELKTNYIEHSSDDNDDDGFYIELIDRELGD
jgi:hypothetical protein